MSWMMSRFIRIEDEVLVSPHRFKDKTHVFLLCILVFILSLVGLSPYDVL